MEPQVLDLAQLARIQGTHRGFLYQHLYSVSCLLSAPTTGVVSIRVERDEDVELEHDGLVVYAQIKTSSAPLTPSVVQGMLERFDAIRSAHHRGARSLRARFALVTNVELGPTLLQRTWPSDVTIATPATTSRALDGTGLIAPPPTLADLLVDAQRRAEGYRLSALRPASLVAKLVGIVAHAAAGERPGSRIATGELEQLCELIAAQIRPLPRVPRYRPQSAEPTLADPSTSVVVVGHAGDGKTAWAAEVAAHASDVVVYVACSSAAGEQVAPRLVEATVATLAARGNVRPYDLVLPGRTGLDALAILDQQLVSRGIRVMAVIDDCHHATASSLLEAVRAARSLRWVLLGRPCPALEEVSTLMCFPRTALGGWSEDVVASVLHEAKCSTRPADVVALHVATKGAPLFVLQATQEIHRNGGDTGAYARALISGTTSGRSAQEVLLEAAVRALDPGTARVASAVATIGTGFTADEWVDLSVKSLGEDKAGVRRALRALVESQIGYETGNGLVAIHDAFLPLLDGRFLSRDEIHGIRVVAAGLLQNELIGGHAAERAIAFIRILASLGRLSDLADVATALAEWFRETGRIAEVHGYLEASLGDLTLSAEDRFWTLDTLSFFDMEDGRHEAAAARLPELERLSLGLDSHARAAVLHKKMLLATNRGETDEVRRLIAAPTSDPRHDRILRYHAAIAEAKAGNIQQAVFDFLAIAKEYMAVLGLTPQLAFGRNVDQLRKMLRPDADLTDVRHLADCYDAILRVTGQLPQFRSYRGLSAPWATKFYALAGATRSALRAGQDLADMILEDLDDPEYARAFIEQNLLPEAARAKLPEMTIPIRAQYAVLCAYCGDHAAAQSVVEALAPYADGLAPHARAELENQIRLVEHLRSRGPPSTDELDARRVRIASEKAFADRMLVAHGLRSPAPEARSSANKIGRNDPCPCGSGRKFKKCCGAPT